MNDTPPRKSVHSPESADHPPPAQRPDGGHCHANSLRAGPLRFVGLGAELACFALACGLLGFGLDRWLASDRPYAALLGVVSGFAVGMVRFIRMALRDARQQDGEHRD